MKRVWVPRETKHGFFQTHDRETYQRDPETNVIRRVHPKVRGKAARRAEREARRLARERLARVGLQETS